MLFTNKYILKNPKNCSSVLAKQGCSNTLFINDQFKWEFFPTLKNNTGVMQ